MRVPLAITGTVGLVVMVGGVFAMDPVVRYFLGDYTPLGWLHAIAGGGGLFLAARMWIAALRPKVTSATSHAAGD